MVLNLGAICFCHYSPLGTLVPKSPDRLLVLPCVPPLLSCPAFVEDAPASVVAVELESLRVTGGALPSFERLISTFSCVPAPPKPKSSKLRSGASPPADEPDPLPDSLASAADSPPPEPAGAPSDPVASLVSEPEPPPPCDGASLPEAPELPELDSACSTRPSNKSGSGAAANSCPTLQSPPTIKTANTRQASTGLGQTIFFPCILP